MKFTLPAKLHPSVPFVVTLFILLYIGLNAWIYFNGSNILPFNQQVRQAVQTISVVKEKGSFGFLSQVKPTPTSPPRPIARLPEGKQSWKMSYGPAVTGPKMDTVTIDPLTPKVGDTLKVTITAKHDAAIAVVAILVTDNKQTPIQMKRIAGTDTDGTWETTFTMNDSYDYTYYIEFTLTSANGNWTGAITLRK